MSDIITAMPPQKGGFCELLGAVTVEEDAACSLTKTLLRKRVSTTMTVDNVTILCCQKYLVNLLPSCTCDCSLLISVGCKTKNQTQTQISIRSQVTISAKQI
jgi:hypothetical protein